MDNKTKLNDYDIKMFQLFVSGYTQREAAEYFKKRNIKPCSLSMIEKKLKKFRQGYRAKTNTQLIAMLVREEII